MVKFSVADSSSGPLRMRTCAAFLAEGTNWAETGFESSKPPVKTVIASVGSSLFIFTPRQNCKIDEKWKCTRGSTIRDISLWLVRPGLRDGRAEERDVQMG